MDMNERKSLSENTNSNSSLKKVVNSRDSSKEPFKVLKNIVIDLFNIDDTYSVEKYLSKEFSLNKYNKDDIISLIINLQEIFESDDENLRNFSIFLLHVDKDVRNTALNALEIIINRGISFSGSIFEIILSSLLVDVKQETTEYFAIFLAKSENTRLIEYLVENLYYEIYLKNEYLRKEKNRVKHLITNDEDKYLKEWETFARYRLMSGEKITNIVASADCGEYQDALLDGKGLISFYTCIKALSEYGTNLYLPSLSGLIINAENKLHKIWLKFLSVIQGDNQYIPDLLYEIENNSDSSYVRYFLKKLKGISIQFNQLHENLNK